MSPLKFNHLGVAGKCVYLFDNATDCKKIIDTRRIKRIVAGFEFFCRGDQLLQQIGRSVGGLRLVGELRGE